MRVNFVGDLGWELHHPIEYQNHIFDALMAAGAEFGIGLCGMRAMDSLRIEKSYRMWAQDLTTEYSILEAGLDRFVKLDKGPFVGREALIEQAAAGIPQRFVTLEVEADDADPWGNEPIYLGDTMVGRATAGAFGHCTDKSLALAYIAAEDFDPGAEYRIPVLGCMRPAALLENAPYDPDGTKLRQ